MQQILPDIINDLQKSQMSQKEIAKKYNVSQMTVSNINQGLRWYNNELTYPLRNNS